MKEDKFSIKLAVKTGWQLTKANIKFYILTLIILWIVQSIPNYLGSLVENSVLSLVISLISWVINVTVSMIFISVSLKIVDGAQGQFSDLSPRFSILGKYLLANIYYGLIVLAGLLLLIIPGIIWAIRYQFFGYLMIDQGLGPKQALSKSKDLTQGIKFRLFLFGLVLLLLNLAGALLLLIGLFVSIPVSMLAMAYVYRQLTGRPSPLPTPASSEDWGPTHAV